MKRRDVQPIYSNTYQQMHRRYWVTRFLIILAVTLLFFSVWLFWQHEKQVRLSRFPIHGVALNQQAGFVDFQQLANQHVAFVYLKATTGASYTDDQFQSGYDRAEGTRLKLGVDHFFSFSTTPTAQLDHFKKAVGPRLGDLPIAVQVDFYGDYTAQLVSKRHLGRRLLVFLNKLRLTTGHPVIVWCSQKVWQAVKVRGLGAYGRWVTDSNPGQISRRIRFIEYNPDGKMTINGQAQTVSLSVFNGTKVQWKQYLNRVN